VGIVEGGGERGKRWEGEWMEGRGGDEVLRGSE
jgi:hypothetical protein